MRIERLIVAVTYRCQCDCVHCSQGEYRVSPRQELTLGELQGVFNTAARYNLKELNIFGGEALLRPDIHEILVSGKRAARHLTLDTNGVAITPELAGRLKEDGVDLMYMSLFSTDADVNARLHRRKGVFDEIMQATDVLLEAGIPLFYSTCIFRNHLDSQELERLVELARRKGVNGVRLLYPLASGRWLTKSDILLTHDELKKINRLVDNRFVFVAEGMNEPDYPGCNGVHGTVFVSPYGEVQPCNFVPVHLGNVREEPLDLILDRARRHRFFTPAFQEKKCPMRSPEFLDTIQGRLDATTRLASLGPYDVLDLAPGCTSDCEDCPSRVADKREDGMEGLKHLLANAHPEYPDVWIRGGEPFLHPQIVSYFSQIGEAGRRPIIVSPGGVFANPSVADLALKSGLAEVHIPVWGEDRDEYDTSIGTPGGFFTLLEAIKQLASRGIDVTVYADGMVQSDLLFLVKSGVSRVVQTDLNERFFCDCSRPFGRMELPGARVRYTRPVNPPPARIQPQKSVTDAGVFPARQPETADRPDTYETMPERVDVLLLFPPSYECYHMPEIALPRLTAYLREQGYEVVQQDLNIDYWESYLFQDKPFLMFVKLLKDRFQPDADCLYDPVRDLYGIHFSRKPFDMELCRKHVFRHRKEIFNWVFEQSRRKRLDRDTLLSEMQAPDVLLDAFLTWKTASLLKNREPEWVGISVISPQQLVQTWKLVHELRKQGLRAPVVLGGPWAKLGREFLQLPDYDFIFDVVDVVVTADGEEPLKALIHAGENRENWREIPNLIFRGPNGERIRTASAVSAALTELPAPDFRGLNLDAYPDLMLPLERASMCYYRKCTFCWHNHPDRQWNLLDPKTIVDRVEFYQVAHGAKAFAFIDNAVSENHTRRIAREILKRGLRVRWMMQARFNPEFARDEYVELLAQSGCETIFFGLETAQDKTLKHYKKGINPGMVSKMLETCHRHGIQASVYLMVYPGQRREDLQATFDFCLSHRQYINFPIIQRFLLNHNCIAYDRPDLLAIRALPNEPPTVDFYDLPYEAEGLVMDDDELDKLVGEFVRAMCPERKD